MTYSGKCLIGAITWIFLNCSHSQLVDGSWMRRGAIIHLVIVRLNNPENFIGLTTSALFLVLVVYGLVGLVMVRV